MAKAEVECPKCLPGWLVQFADLMSLLLVFFVLLLSMASMDKKKVEEYFDIMRRSMGFLEGSTQTAAAEEESLSEFFMDATEAGSGEEVGRETSDSDIGKEVEELTMEFNANNQNQFEDLQISYNGNNEFTLDIPSSLLFDENQAVFKTLQAKEFIARLAKTIRIMPRYFDIEVIGHSYEEDNPLVLATNRAVNVAKELIKNSISPSQIKVSSYGDQMPKSSSKYENRRVELRFIMNNTPSKSQKSQADSFFDNL